MGRLIGPCRHIDRQLRWSGVLRHLLIFTTSLLGIAIAAVACAGPGADVQPGSPAAQATDTRHTAIAEVQRIIANNPTATPLPQSTPTPTPTCQNAIWWMEARSHIGESRTIQGTVVGSRSAPDGQMLLDVGQLYPDPTGLAVLVPAAAAQPLDGKSVCIAGRITLSEGRATVQVRDPSSIQVLN